MKIPSHHAAPLTLLYRDDHYVVIHKPAGLLVHRSRISQDREFVLQRLRDQVGAHVFPVHRLDRATAGALAFGFSAEAARRLALEFEQRRVAKRYLAVARGWTEADGVIDHPVADEDGNGIALPAKTRYKTVSRVELPVRVDRYPSARYSLLCVEPISGRRQQIRKHFKHISHPLIGDTTHGNGRHNRFFRAHFEVSRLLLLAYALRFCHPYQGNAVSLYTPIDKEWHQMLELFGLAQADIESLCATAVAVTKTPSDKPGDGQGVLAQ